MVGWCETWGHLMTHVVAVHHSVACATQSGSRTAAWPPGGAATLAQSFLGQLQLQVDSTISHRLLRKRELFLVGGSGGAWYQHGDTSRVIPARGYQHGETRQEFFSWKKVLRSWLKRCEIFLSPWSHWSPRPGPSRMSSWTPFGCVWK